MYKLAAIVLSLVEIAVGFTENSAPVIQSITGAAWGDVTQVYLKVQSVLQKSDGKLPKKVDSVS
jgi:hypothetical protein